MSVPKIGSQNIDMMIPCGRSVEADKDEIEVLDEANRQITTRELATR